MVYYLSELDATSFNYNAGFKARDDVEKIFSNLDVFEDYLRFSKIIRPKIGEDKIHKLIRHIKSRQQWISLLKKTKRNDVIVMQYPFVNSYFGLPRLINHYAEKGVKFIFLVHDLEFIRYDSTKAKHMKNGVGVLNAAHRLIVHNPRMQRFVEDIGVTTSTICLQCFDYLTDVPYSISDPKAAYEKKEVAYAGNLSKDKAGFTYQLPPTPIFNLYGKGLDEEQIKNENVHYQGFFKPNQPKIEGTFGLVWDGDSIDGCQGHYGNYQKINHPHKTSLYLSLGLPIIVWKEAAVSDLVDRYEIGIKTENLNQLSDSLASLSFNQYQKMVWNAQKVAEKLRKGEFTKTAIEKAIKEIC